MILFHILSVYSQVYDQCDLPPLEGYILTKFYKPYCPYSLKVKGIVDDIATKLEGSDVAVRYVDCTMCNCAQDDIVTVPTLKIHKDQKEIAKHRGSGTFDEYADFILQNIQLDGALLGRGLKSVPGTVMTLKQTDVEKGLVGPWVVLFHDRKDRPMADMMTKMAGMFGSRANFASINSHGMTKIEKMYSIQYYPVIIGIYDGIIMPFLKEMQPNLVAAFIDKLIEPSFQFLDVNKFTMLAKGLGAGEPIFVVLYSDLSMANSYFKRMAHEYKFKTTIYKSEDPRLFDMASLWPQFLFESRNAIIRPEDKVILTVYKHGAFHRCPHKLSDLGKVSEWIFLSHFPHVTRITSENFYTVFHGLKPVVLLITRSEEYVTDIERASTNYHLGQPFTNFVFSTIDVDMFPLFVPSLLPNLRHPTVLIFDPSRQLFYHRSFKVESKTLDTNVFSLIRDYQKGKVGLYPPSKGKVLKYMLVVFGVLGVAMSFTISFMRLSKKQE